jgi:cyclase
MAANAPPEDAVWSRRRMLGAATGAGIGILALQAETAIAQFSFASRVDGELHPLAPGVFAWLQHVPPGESGFAVANCGLVATGDRLLAIDATASPVQARQFMAAAVKATGKDFGRVVLTHSHGDHVHGLAMFGPVEVIAQENCRTAMLAGASTTKPGGWQPRRGWARGDEVFRNVLPNVTYTERMRFYEGDSAVELLWPGRGHTSGDTVVILPRQRIAFIGDIGFFGLTPLMGDGYCGD